MIQEKTVYVVHCVDTEGPLYESIEATFERLKEIFGISGIKPTKENLRKIQNCKLDLNGLEQKVAEVFSEKLLNYNDDWTKLDKMLYKIMGEEFRDKFPDSNGQGWIFNWHCMDHLEYELNPRRKSVGMHLIFDHYSQKIAETNSKDRIHWHFHPEAVYKEGDKLATSYVNSSNLYKIICRRIIERNWFPTVNRAGYHTERPDSHYFLEQWIPFDYSNQACKEQNDSQLDIAGGRYGDWRLAPQDWSVYHPSHDNYQVPGHCRRKIARCLNIGTRLRLLTQEEVDKAFQRANESVPTILAFANHDFREMSGDICNTYNMLQDAKKKYPEVNFEYMDSIDAMRKLFYEEKEIYNNKLKLKVGISNNVLTVETISGKTFGPQPFLAIKTSDQRFIHDNFDAIVCGESWSYTFDKHTIPLKAVEEIGVASNDKYGNTYIEKIKID
jgi:hypothetical protein